MNDLTKSVNEINRLHQLANSTAQQAIDYAKELGELLLGIKKELPYGKFTSWLEKNVDVSIRQAQRYMAIASGKKASLLEISSKNDIVSHLVDESSTDWIPKEMHIFIGTWDKAVYWIVPAIGGGFHISKLYRSDDSEPTEDDFDAPDESWDGVSLYDGTIHPIKANIVQFQLKYFGIPDPFNVKWDSGKVCEAYERPFGEPMVETEKFYRKLDL